MLSVNPLTNYKFLVLSKLEAFTDDKRNVNKKKEVCYETSKKYCGKRRKCWLPVFSPFSTMFSKAFFFQRQKISFFQNESICKRKIKLLKR